MRCLVLAAMTVTAAVGCESKPAAPAPAPANAPAPLVDLTATSTLAPMRTAFNAHKGEARFLTLLSPT